MCVLKMRWNDGIIIFINVLPLPSSNDCSFEKRIECDNICVITNTSIKMNLMELSFDFIVLYLTHISHILQNKSSVWLYYISNVLNFESDASNSWFGSNDFEVTMPNHPVIKRNHAEVWVLGEEELENETLMKLI